MKISLKRVLAYNLCMFIFVNVHSQFHAVYLSEERIKKISIDGCPDDWNWVPEKYIIKKDIIKIEGKNLNDNYSFQRKVIVGWSDVTNWIYILAVVEDNSISSDSDNIKKLDINELFGISLSTLENFNGEFNNKYDIDRKCIYENFAIKLHFLKSIYDSTDELLFDTGPKWMLNSNQIKWGYRNKKNKITFELGMSVWSFWDARGLMYSQPLNLKPNKEIKLTVAFEDLIKDGIIKQDRWVTKSNSTWYKCFEDMSTFILDPPITNKNIEWNDIEKIINNKSNFCLLDEIY